MNMTPLIVSLPVNDLKKAFAFYHRGLGIPLAKPGKADEMPEPVVLGLNEGAHLMLVPADGFQWVLGTNTVAERGTSECVLGLGAATNEEVDELFTKARALGGTSVAEPSTKPWGYSASFQDLDGHAWLVVANRPTV